MIWLIRQILFGAFLLAMIVGGVVVYTFASDANWPVWLRLAASGAVIVVPSAIYVWWPWARPDE